jgi:hypothetical protein
MAAEEMTMRSSCTHILALGVAVLVAGAAEAAGQHNGGGQGQRSSSYHTRSSYSSGSYSPSYNGSGRDSSNYSYRNPYASYQSWHSPYANYRPVYRPESNYRHYEPSRYFGYTGYRYGWAGFPYYVGYSPFAYSYPYWWLPLSWYYPAAY